MVDVGFMFAITANQCHVSEQIELTATKTCSEMSSAATCLAKVCFQRGSKLCCHGDTSSIQF